MNDSITLRIPTEMKDELEKICVTEGKNISLVVREALNRLIALHKFETLRKEILPYAEKVGVFSDEDILNSPS